MSVRVVTGWPGTTLHSLRLTVRTFLRTAGRLAILPGTFAFAFLTIAGRGCGLAATWTAPPPMIAPPAVQAQSFARAILTDISSSSFLFSSRGKSLLRLFLREPSPPRDAEEAAKRKAVNHIMPAKASSWPSLYLFRTTSFARMKAEPMPGARKGVRAPRFAGRGRARGRPSKKHDLKRLCADCLLAIGALGFEGCQEGVDGHGAR
ncbi:MAG: hypothetical protein ACFBQW_08205 [Sphingomonadaceae bacterium]